MKKLQLSTKQISHLRSLAHALNPVVMIGQQGLTENVLKEINVSLNAHELIKIKVFSDEKAVRAELLNTICESVQAVAVHHIGKQLIIYRPSEKARISFPD